MDVQERLDWLAKHDASVRPFTPQPYVQLANVLRRQGMISAVNTVMIKREDLQRDADMEQAVHGNEWWGLFALVMLLRPFLSLPFKWMFGYGHQPSRVLFWIAVYLGDHHLFCPANPHPRAVCADLLGCLDLAGLAGQFPNGAPPPRLAALARADGRLGADHIRARLYKL